jgi:hypothetical protein
MRHGQIMRMNVLTYQITPCSCGPKAAAARATGRPGRLVNHLAEVRVNEKSMTTAQQLGSRILRSSEAVAAWPMLHRDLVDVPAILVLAALSYGTAAVVTAPAIGRSSRLAGNVM